MTTEHTYQHKILLPWLTTPLGQGGLGWSMPAAGNDSSTAIDPASGLLWPDALDFLRGGNDANALAWSDLVAAERKVGGALNAQVRAESTARQALIDRLAQVDTVLEVLRTGVSIGPFRFSMWNRKPSAGDTTVVLARDAYSRNTLRATPEVPVVGEAGEESKLGGRSGKAGFKPSVRLDIAFHLNGLPFGYLEAKAQGSGQSAQVNGRKQLAQDFISFAVPSLLRLYAEHETSEGRAWPGLAGSRKLLADTWRRRALNGLPLWFGKSAWRATADLEGVFMAPSAMECLMEVDAALMEQAQALRSGKSFDWASRYTRLVDRLMEMSGGLPPVLLDMPDQQRCGWDQPRAHLEALLGTVGLDQEIQLFGHPTRRKDSKEVSRLELLMPRAPQRTALGQIQSWVERMYGHETKPDWLERDLRERLTASLPGLSREEVELRVDERLRFRNGQEAYSIVIQGAAGVGKTNLATWTALTLHDMLETDASGKPTSQAMFDYILVLTDRVELRKNIAEQAEQSNGSRGTVTEITTATMLGKVLGGQPVRGSGRILVVNLQKFPSLREKIKAGEARIKRNKGRIAFIIDEVHRSNQGKLNSETQEAFLDEVGELGATAGTSGKKNLIIGLTATPTDAILARFGLWRAGTGAGDPGAWTPHFAYGMTQAIEDGYVLDPMLGLMRLETILDIDEAGTLDAAGGKIDHVAQDVDHLEIYENPEYQRRTADAFARIFLTSTVPTIRDNHAAILVGRGKAMVTTPSVKAAIGMHQAIKDALLRLANNARGTPWERYAHIARDIANERTFILYSNPGHRAAISQREGTGINGECGPLNPRMPDTGAVRTESQIIDGFRGKGAGSDGNARNAIVVVVDKLLTGFDEGTLHTLMIARNLKGVGLLQTMCRVNRTRPNKHNCLVIDASYDPDGEGIGPEAVRVFRRYGGLAASRLDGLALMDRVVEQRVELLKNKLVARGWREWKKGSDEATKMAAANLVAMDVKAGAGGLEDALALRRKVGGYLAQQSQAEPIMKLEVQDLDREFLHYLYRLHNNLKVDLPGGGRVPVQFQVREIGFTPEEPQDILSASSNPRSQRTPMGDLEDDWLDEPDGGRKTRDLHDLQEQQDKKAQKVGALRQAVSDLCEGIEQVARNNEILGRLREDLIEQRLDSAEASDAFRKIVASVKVSRVKDSQGRDVLWVDQVPGRREVIGWLTDPRRTDRMGWAMGAWMGGAQNE